MARGRKPDPTAQKRGTANKKSQGKAKPVIDQSLVFASPNTVALPDPPATLPPEVHEVWNAAVAEMSGNRHMRQVDLIQLSVWCEAVYNHAQASDSIHKFGLVVKGKHGPMTNPMLKVQKDAAATIRMYSDMLGLNPLARIRAGLMEIAGESMLFSLNEKLDQKALK